VEFVLRTHGSVFFIPSVSASKHKKKIAVQQLTALPRPLAIHKYQFDILSSCQTRCT